MYRCKEERYSFFCERKHGIFTHFAQKHKQAAFEISGYQSTTRHSEEMTSTLLRSSQKLCIDRFIQYQAPTNSAGLGLIIVINEHVTAAVMIQQRWDIDTRGIPETISTDTEYVNCDSRAIKNVIMALITLKRQFSVKGCDNLIQVMFEVPDVLERYFTNNQNIASVSRSHKQQIKNMKPPFDFEQKHVDSPNGLL